MSEPFDLIAVGETMLSLVAVDGTVSTATTFRATHGGAESNTCVGAARLGLRTAWVSRLGADPIGDRIMSALDAEGVDVRWVIRDPDRPTGVMLRDTSGAPARYDRAGSAASVLSPEDLDGVPVEEVRAVLVTGVTAFIGEGPQRTAVALLERARGLRVVDPNLRLGLWGSARTEELVVPLIERADLVLGGEAELSSLLGGDHGFELARRCAKRGPSEVVLKRGPAGAAVLDADGAWHEHPGSPVRDVDPVGAGDAFNAGYIAARLAGAPPPEALARGAACGAQAASTLGDTGALFDVESDTANDDPSERSLRPRRKLVARNARHPEGFAQPTVPLSSVVVSEDLVYTSGQVALDATGTLVPGGLEEQTARVFENLQACLATAGCTLDDVVKVNAYLTDLGQFDVFNRVYAERFSEPYPARTTVGVKLADGLLVEVEAVARIPRASDT